MLPETPTALVHWHQDVSRWRTAIRRLRRWARRRRAARLASLERDALRFGVTDPLVAHNWTIGIRPVLTGDAFTTAVEYLRAVKDHREEAIAEEIIDRLWNRWLVPHGARARECRTASSIALPALIGGNLIGATV